MKPSLSAGDYYEACNNFISEVYYYMEHEATSDYKHTEADNQAYLERMGEEELTAGETAFAYGIIAFLFAIVVGSISVCVMAINTGGKTTTHQGTYLTKDEPKVIAKRDTYIRTTVTKTRKPTNNDSSSGSSSGGGVSSGGSSHSGGGSSF